MCATQIQTKMLAEWHRIQSMHQVSEAWRLSFPLVAHRKTKRLWPPPFDKLSLSFASTAPLPLSGPCRSSLHHSPPLSPAHLWWISSSPPSQLSLFPVGLFWAGSPQGFAQPLHTIPPVPTYIYSMFITSLSTSHQLSTPRHRAMVMAIQVLLRCMLLQCMYLCHLMHI